MIDRTARRPLTFFGTASGTSMIFKLDDNEKKTFSDVKFIPYVTNDAGAMKTNFTVGYDTTTGEITVGGIATGDKVVLMAMPII